MIRIESVYIFWDGIVNSPLGQRYVLCQMHVQMKGIEGQESQLETTHLIDGLAMDPPLLLLVYNFYFSGLHSPNSSQL